MTDYDYRHLDPLVHSRIRLSVLAILASVEDAEFTYLREQVKATDGNLGAHLVQRPSGGTTDVRHEAELLLDRPVTIVMQLAPVALEPITVEAGTYQLGNLPDVTLSELDVVRTPGSAADPFRAIQTFPGLQRVGDGGGALRARRRCLRNEGPARRSDRHLALPSRYRPHHLLRPLRSLHAQGRPVLCRRLRGRVRRCPLRNRRSPDHRQAGGERTRSHCRSRRIVGPPSPRPIENSFGARATATYTNTDALLRLNGRREEFDEVPESTDLSGGFEWAYRDGASLQSFAMFQTDRVGVRIDDPGYAGIYRSDARTGLVAVSGRDAFGSLGVSWGVATSGSRKDESFGAFRTERGDRLAPGTCKGRSLRPLGDRAGGGGRIRGPCGRLRRIGPGRVARQRPGRAAHGLRQPGRPGGGWEGSGKSSCSRPTPFGSLWAPAPTTPPSRAA